MLNNLPLGIEDFRELRQAELLYVDKTQLAMDLMAPQGGGLEALREALFSGDEQGLQALLQTYLSNVLSYHDLAGANEQVYHAFLTGLLAALEPSHQVRSNREAGVGDYRAELSARGATPIHAYAIALRGKQALVKRLRG